MMRGALLGAGNIAREGHLPSYASPLVADRLSIVAAADPCFENRQAIQRLAGTVRAYADPRELLERERPDFVDICAPPSAHLGLIQLANEYGCHVLCEKPMTTDLGEAITIRRLFQRRPAVVMPCHQYHFAPQWQAVRRAIRAGEVGRIHTGVVTVHRVGANPGSAAWKPAWRTDRRIAGGGILVDHGAHLFYQLCDLFGEPESIACVTDQRLAGCAVDDTATIMLRFSGALVRVNLTWAARSRYSGHRYLGESGEVRLLDDRVEVDGRAGLQTMRFPAGMSQGSAHAGWFEPLLLEFAGRMERGDCRLDRLDEAITVAACITHAYSSAAEQGRPQLWRLPADMQPEVSLAAAD